MTAEIVSNLLAARMQMAFTLGFHIILACFGVGLPVLMLFAEGQFLRTADAGWKILARRWSKAFAVLFGVGAVSGTVLSFELGLLWPQFMGAFGAVIGLPFTLEGFAFFLEAIFVGIYLYGWDRLPPRVHWLTGFPIAIAGLASAWFVVTANAWMNVPRGFQMADGKILDVDPFAAMLNPATGPQTTHMILAAYMVTGFVVASVYAVARLRGKDTNYHRRAMALGVALGAIVTPVQIIVGDWAAKTVAQTQPVKLAAMEGQFRTEAWAPLRIGGLPDEEARITRYALEIPGGLSWLAYGDPNAVVQGLDDAPPQNQPPVAIVHLAFQLMVAIGAGLMALSLWAGWSVWRQRCLPESRVFLWALAGAGPAVVAALEAGWVVTEVGRQPWIVQGVMRTSEAVTAAPGIVWVLAATLAIYVVLGVGAVLVLQLLARAPFTEDHHGA
ncbi:MAG: cytochrome ubiquinol oxidase subunit I [Candidatus Binatia bacterium]